MHTKPVIAAVCAAALALGASSASAAQPQNAVAKEKQAGSKKVCRWVETTGSHRTERICLTAEEWRKVDEYLAREF